MNKLIAALLVALCFVLCHSNQALAQNSSRFEITLDANWESKLKSLGTVQSAVRDEPRGKIVAIQLEYADTQDKPHVENNMPFTIAGDACQLTITDDLLEMIRKQPVRIPVPEDSQFAQVFLNYAGQAGASSRSSSSRSRAMRTASSTTGGSAPMHFIKLADRQVMSGQMSLTEKLKFKTKFGEVEISLGQIAGIRFHIDGEDSAKIVLKNGDTITGIPEMESLNLTTDWGRAELEPAFVDEITTSEGASFSQSNDPTFGQRWQLNNR